MAMNGLQIQKLLPKTNCKECGSNTCLAFAMRLAAKKANLSECPYASEEAKQVLGADSEAPVKVVSLGERADRTVGEETVLYRHEKTFVHPTLLAVEVKDIETLERIRAYTLERVGETLTVSGSSITEAYTGTAFLTLVEQAAAFGVPAIIRAESGESAAKAAAAAKGTHSVLAGVTCENAAVMREIAERNGHSLAVTAPSLDELMALTAQLKESGYETLLMEFQTHSMAEAFQTNTIARRAAIRHNVKALGYPTLTYVNGGGLLDDTALAVMEIAKYGGICVLPSFDPAQLSALMALRQNIYTDPQKPIQVEPKIYPIGEPGRDAPVFVTTNFSLTYFLVSGEIENAGISAWLVIPECEGMSVLTAWAAGKFSGASVAKFIQESGLEGTVDTRRIVIPGYVAQISGELEECLPGWSVLVGPQEAADIESFINAVLR